jgi:curved DNA binding protein
VSGRKADVLMAAQTAADVALRMLKTNGGHSNWDLSDTVTAAVKDFDCNMVEGMLSHELRRNTLDGEKTILFNPGSDAQRRDIKSVNFEDGEAWCIDILVSSAEGKASTKETRTTIFKRNGSAQYNLKMKTSREVLSEVTKRFGELGFSLRYVSPAAGTNTARSLEDERKARMGIVECQSHGLVTPYPVLYEKDPEAVVAHVMFTVLLMPTGPMKITSTGNGACGSVDVGAVKSEKKSKDAKVLEILSQSIKVAGGKKKKLGKADGEK